ncbi:hypothetical protein MMA38_23730, partial [Salmonella enterica]|nr:hypothetical protein [Salmonella enterica]
YRAVMRAWRMGLAQVARGVALRLLCVAMHGPGQEAGQLLQGTLVHIAFKFNDDIERDPIFMPAPGVELGMVGQAQIDVVIAR